MPAVGQLLISHRHEGSLQTLVLRGELDLATAPELEDAVAAVSRDGARELVLDLRHVAFMDSSGLRTVLAAMDTCRLHGCEFMLIPGTGACRRLFELTGVLDELPVREADGLP
jgi:anti-sigma B factor antagonist